MRGKVRRAPRRSALVVICASLLAGVLSSAEARPIGFEPLPTSAPCVPGGPDLTQPPIVLPEGYSTRVLAQEGPNFPDQADMNTVNETGRRAGRFLYRTHELRENAAVSVTDLKTGETRILAQRSDWERFDGLEWTPWGTLLAGEEVRAGRTPQLVDPQVPQALGGLLYEIDPRTGTAVPREAIGSRAHEGIAMDAAGNVYGISEVTAAQGGGSIYRFVPDRRRDLSRGTLYALKVTSANADRTGEAYWEPLDAAASIVDSDAAATAVGATKYGKPEDVEVRRGALYVAVSDEHRVIAVDLHGGRDEQGRDRAFVWDYVRAGVNAPPSGAVGSDPNSFAGPDNLAFDRGGRLFISEDPGGRPKTMGNDVWAALPPTSEDRYAMAADTVRFASLSDCGAEPSGIYFRPGSRTLYLNIMHRGGSGPNDLFLPDLSLAVERER